MFVIGGHEEKVDPGRAPILQAFVEACRGEGPVLVVTAASELDQELIVEYCDVFRAMGATSAGLSVNERADALQESNVELARKASGFFLTGGDQLRLTARLGGTPVLEALRARWQQGAAVGGTSAGAAAMSRTMLVWGAGDRTDKLENLEMAPGLDIIDGLLADTHFSERGRIARLVSAVARNPGEVGLGLDEDTAVQVSMSDKRFVVLGSGAVYVLDGRASGWSSLGAHEREGILRIDDLTLHVLADGDGFDLTTRRPIHAAR